MATVDLTSWVYLAFDSKDVLIYVGITKGHDWRVRVKDHEQEYWWPECTRVAAMPVDSLGEAYRIERYVLKTHRPRHNAHGNPDYHYRPNLRGRRTR